jgi:hypothetical protein
MNSDKLIQTLVDDKFFLFPRRVYIKSICKYKWMIGRVKNITTKVYQYDMIIEESLHAFDSNPIKKMVANTYNRYEID